MRLRVGRRRPVGQTGLDRGAGEGTWLGLCLVLALTVVVGHAVPCRAAGLVLEAPNLDSGGGLQRLVRRAAGQHQPGRWHQLRHRRRLVSADVVGPSEHHVYGCVHQYDHTLHLRDFGDYRRGWAALSGHLPQHAVHGLRLRVRRLGLPAGRSGRHVRLGPRLLRSQPDEPIRDGHDRVWQSRHLAVG